MSARKIIAAVLMLAAAIIMSLYIWGQVKPTGDEYPDSPPPVGTVDLNTKAPEETPPEGDDQTHSPSAAPTTSWQVEDFDHPPDGPQAPQIGDWEPVVNSFAKEWANDTGGHDGWLKRMRPYITDDLYEGFESTDPMWIQSMEFRSADETTTFNKDVAARRVDLFFKGRDKPAATVVVAIQDNGEWLVSAML